MTLSKRCDLSEPVSARVQQRQSLLCWDHGGDSVRHHCRKYLYPAQDLARGSAQGREAYSTGALKPSTRLVITLVAQALASGPGKPGEHCG